MIPARRPTARRSTRIGVAALRLHVHVWHASKFAANETQKTIDIPINLDAYTEGPEVFTVKLSNPTGGAVLAVPSTATVTISDSPSPTPNAIDDTTSFVRQQYRDFLNRDADRGGSGLLEEQHRQMQRPGAATAGTDPGRVHRSAAHRRLSAAFFLSIEFKQHGRHGA